MGKASARQENL